MPMSLTISKKEVIKQYELIKMLEEKCKTCRMLVGKEAEATVIYSISNPIAPKYDAMVAISKYDKIHAMLTPADLSEEELLIFEYALRGAEPDEEIIVFTKREYKAVKKYLYDKKNKVILIE